MAVITTAIVDRYQADNTGARQAVIADIVLSSSYSALGETIAPAALGLSAITGLRVIQASGNALAYHKGWDGTKLRLFRQTAATGALVEAPGATDTSGTVRVEALGRLS